MSRTLQQAGQLLSRLTPGENAQLLQWVARDLGTAFPSIESLPGISGGDACIVRTRILVWILEKSRALGMTEADIRFAHPTLRAEDRSNAWAYARSHREEIERQIAENEEALS